MKGQLMPAIATMSRRRHLQLTSRGFEQMANAIQLFFPDQQDLLYRQDDEGFYVTVLTDDSPRVADAWRLMSSLHSATLIAEEIQSWLEGLDYSDARRICASMPMTTGDNPQLDGFTVASVFEDTGRRTGYHYLVFTPAWI